MIDYLEDYNNNPEARILLKSILAFMSSSRVLLGLWPINSKNKVGESVMKIIEYDQIYGVETVKMWRKRI